MALRSSLFSKKISGGMFAMEDMSRSTGDRFYVDSGATATGGTTTGFGSSPDTPFTTWAAAVSAAKASQGDIIYLMPGHAETYSAAAALVLSKVGVSTIGLGRGTDRPTITFDDVNADINITGANVHIENVVFVNDVDTLVAPIDVDAAHFSMVNCEFNDDTAAKQTVRWILGDANADYMTIRGCINHGSDTAGATAWITLNGADHVVIADNTSHGDFAAANIENITAACTDLLIARNHLENANAVDVCIEGFAAATGFLSLNFCRIATDGQLTGINTPGALSLFENYQVNDDGDTGALIGTVAT